VKIITSLCWAASLCSTRCYLHLQLRALPVRDVINSWLWHWHMQLSITISCPHGAQQQTSHMPLLLMGQTDGHLLHILCGQHQKWPKWRNFWHVISYYTKISRIRKWIITEPMFSEHGVKNTRVTKSINYWHTCTQHPSPSQNSCVWCTCVSAGRLPQNHDSPSVPAMKQTPDCWISSDYILHHKQTHTHFNNY